MRATLDKITEDLRTSYWFIPAMMALAAFLLALGSIAVDRWMGKGWLEGFLFLAASRPEGARAVVSAIGGSMIGVAGTVFSVTMAAVVYASGQYGPRLLTNFLSDRGNQITLGTFTATFVFSMMVLQTIQSPDEAGQLGAGGAGFVPNLALFICFGLALASIAVLIYFIHHVPSRIHISNVIRDIGEGLIAMVGRRFPSDIGAPACDGDKAAEAEWQLPPAFRFTRRGAAADDAERAEPAYAEVRATNRGYIQFLDEATLIGAAGQAGVVVRLVVRPGSFVFSGSLLMDVWPAGRLTPALAEELRSAIATGARRTPADDMLFMVDELVEIAARALSPGVNDPFTATSCIDWLSAALAEIARRPTPDPLRIDSDGKLCVVAEPLDFADYLRLSLGAIREYAATDKIAARHFLMTLEMIGRHCANEAARAALVAEARALTELARARLTGPSLREVEAESRTVLNAMLHPSRRRAYAFAEGRTGADRAEGERTDRKPAQSSS